jgi:hypothetical protein
MAGQVRIFKGEHEAVEKAINRWLDDGPDGRQVVSVMPLTVTEGQVSMMMMYQDPPANGKAPGLVVPKMRAEVH